MYTLPVILSEFLLLIQAVLDHSSWIMNLTVANAQDPSIDPVWFELYQAKRDYALTDLSPRSMDAFYQQLVTDDALFQMYFE